MEKSEIDDEVVDNDQPVAPTAYPRNRLTKRMRDYGISELTKWRDNVWDAADDTKQGCLHPEAFLPDNAIKSILDFVFSLTTVADIARMTKDALLCSHQESLLKVVQRIAEHMKDMKVDEQVAARKSREQKVAQAKTEMERSGIRWVLNSR